jgi:two-component sensor histidine kinase
VTTPAELAVTCTDLSPPELGHLQRLLGAWSVLADLSFSDLLLVVPTTRIPGEDDELVVMGQIRPSNRPTLLEQDLVGQTVAESAWRLAAAALERGEVVRGAVHHPMIGEAVPVENVPVRFDGKVIGVMVRVYSRSVHALVPYEKNYLDVFGRLERMITESDFPFPDEDVGTEETPRVGDGFVLVDAQGCVEFASPNAINAFHRMGIYSAPEGKRFTELGAVDAELGGREPAGESVVRRALRVGRPVVEEVERRPDVNVLVQCIPLIEQQDGTRVVTGAVALMRDVTDVRRLDRLLLSKDAAIREVHHRVKNNLQTISSLLSLQARRLRSEDGRAALYEAERRVRSIALVHEILSRDPGDQVPFREIVDSLVRMAEDSVVSSRPVEIEVRGDLGEVAADVATPLAVTLAELLQNAVEHAFDDSAEEQPQGGEAPAAGHVEVRLYAGREGLAVSVWDDGRGIEPGFDIERTTSLGLSIVRDLVVSQLGGSIDVGSAAAGGTEVRISVPLRRAGRGG